MKLSVKVKINLTDYQREILYCPARFTITEAGTKTGKTFSHLFWLFEQAHSSKDRQVEDGWEYWWIAPVFNQAAIAFNRLRRKLHHSDAYQVNRSNLSVETPEGTIIRFKSANDPDSLYGEDVHAAVFDEFTRAKPEAWYALRSTLTATNGPAKFIGNYKGESNWGHQLALKAATDPTYRYFRITAWDAVRAGILDEAEIEQARKDLPSFMFKALYLAEGDIDQTRLIDDDAIADLLTNTGVPAGQRYITADIAEQGSDRFVACVWEGFRLIDILVLPKTSAMDIETILRNLADKYVVRRSHIAYDADGLGMFLKSYLRGAISFKNGSAPEKVAGQRVEYRNLKSQCYFNMAKRINAGGYCIQCNVDRYWSEIMEELEVVKNRSHGTDNKLEVLRKPEIKTILGRSPDFSDALMMREVFELKRKRTVGAVLQE